MVSTRLRSLRNGWNDPNEVIELAHTAADQIDELIEALKGVVRVADRKTIEFDAARAAIHKAEASP
jgi:hypothetical protein